LVIIPTYNYKFTENNSFNVRTTPSEVGFFSNYLLKKNWKIRTLDPIFSHIIFGKINNFDYKKINDEAFGSKSIFSSFKENNFKIICFCCSTDRITFLHYLEYLFNVPYRYIKEFKGTFINHKSKTKIVYKYNVGKKNTDYSFKEHKINKLINQKSFIKSYFGRFECYSANCNYLYSILMKKMNIDKKFLII
jgi:aminoglycoside 3-N-acetyltransferase